MRAPLVISYVLVITLGTKESSESNYPRDVVAVKKIKKTLLSDFHFSCSCLPFSGVSALDTISPGRGRSGRSRGRPKGSGGGTKAGGKGRGRKSTAGSAAAMAGAKAGAAAASAAAYAAYGYSVSKGERTLVMYL